MPEQFDDLELVCQDRAHPEGEDKHFIWTRGERKFLAKLAEDGKLDGDPTPPKRCIECRRAKKERYAKHERDAQIAQRGENRNQGQ